MTFRYFDATGPIDHDAIKAYALALRDEAIDAFWGRLARRAARLWRNPRQPAVAGRRSGSLRTRNSSLSHAARRGAT